MQTSSFGWKKVLSISLAASAVIVSGVYGGYLYWGLRIEKTVLKYKISALQEFLASANTNLERVGIENGNLTQSLQAERGKNGIFEAQIRDISGTVGTLQKLTSTDPNLLKKYSKVYFLNENYAPARLSSIDPQYLYDKKRPELIHSGVAHYLEGMMAAALRDGLKLQIISAYRSFYEQGSLKFGYKVTYGAGTANQFSAEQGYSEHQLGTAVDFTTFELRDLFSKFDGTEGYKWLTLNAYKFGFILSYPKNNIYYQFEPWHWRFVGVDLATKLHNDNEYFYNLTQTEIDQYLVSIFD